ncbi:MAG: flagellar basal body P-ring formation protein FlgA [bacterium]|nr:flagellar basal body P-ring formation protein FlgA [bacterium]
MVRFLAVAASCLAICTGGSAHADATAEMLAVAPPALEIAPIPAFDEVQLKSEAYVRGPKVYLGEVADIRGANAKALASVEVMGAPAPGDSKRLESALLEARLRHAGVESGSLRLNGPRSVVVKTLHIEVSPEMLSEDLRQFIESQIPWDPRQSLIDITPIPRGYDVPEGDVMVSWWPNPTYRWIGAGAFRGEIRVDGEVKRTIHCKANIEAYVDVLVAVRDIPRGTPIALRDVELQKRAVSALRGRFITEPKEAVGLLARSTIFPGEVVTPRDIVLPRLIKRYQMVKVETRVGTLLVRGSARALKDGCAGDTIPCKNEKSDEQFYGTVRKDGTVIVQ